MGRTILIPALACACLGGSVSAAFQGGQGGLGQGGFGGGGLGGGGGFGGQSGGGLQQEYDGSVQATERMIGTYLIAPETRNILTPGEYSEWPLKLKSGAVIIAEARSDAFDPALEVVDGQGEGNHKVLASNDDRYPGDQRPLLLWRCPKDGDYALRVRCFRDKSGGQLVLKMAAYDSIDLPSEAKLSEKELLPGQAFLIRIPMKAGQLKQIVVDPPQRDNPVGASIRQAISPIGLPEIGLAQRLSPAVQNAILAPVDGDYYVLANAYGQRGKLRGEARDLAPTAISSRSEVISNTAPAAKPHIWSLSAKKGELLEASTMDLPHFSGLVVAEEPDLSKYDLSKTETNPFFPRPRREDEVDKGPALEEMPARARDGRVSVFLVRRDAKIWIASQGLEGSPKDFTLKVRPANSAFVESSSLSKDLKIGYTDYWSFDAKAGDVMSFNASAKEFAGRIFIQDPSMEHVWNWEALPDQETAAWNLIVRKPGRYFVGISAVGDGAAGKYALFRKVFQAKEFKKGTPATGTFASGQAEVWKFTAKPEEPLLVHWKSVGGYSLSICDENGRPADIPRTRVDAQNSYGVLKVSATTMFVIVMTPIGQKAEYSIELRDLPGLVGRVGP